MNEPNPEHTCKSCGNLFSGNYCNICGEKVLLAEDRSFRSFLHAIVITITFADNKFIKTLWLVISKPGFLSNEYIAGRRIDYLNPLSLFFVLNLIYFLFPVIQLFNASLNTQLLAPQRELVHQMVAHKMVSLNMRDIASFSLIYNQKTATLAKLMVMVFVVIASLPLNILYRKKNRYFTDHVAFMVELACFNLFVNAIFLTLITKLFGLGQYLDEQVLTYLFVSTNLYYLLMSGINFYREKSWKLAFKSIAMLLLLKLALEIYRAVLFFITLLTL